MFSEFFEGEYETKKFWIKGLEEDIEQINPMQTMKQKF